MRSSLVLAAFGISLLACAADAAKTADSEWQCAPTPVRNGETVTCTTTAKVTRPAQPTATPAPTGGEVTVRTFGVEGDASDTGSSGAAPAPSGSDESPESVADHASTASPPDAPAPDEYDCSSGKSGASCPPAASAPSGSSDDAYAGATDYRCKTGSDGTTCTRKTIECKEGTMQAGDECIAPGEAPAPAAAPTGTTAPAASLGCTLTQGYWKTHPTKWPTQVLTIGGVAYSQAELLSILNTPPTGDASLILAHQLIASMLSVASGADASQVGSSIQAAQTWMAANKDADGRLPYGVASTSAAGSAGVGISSTLDSYNNGKLNVPHCN